MPKLPGSDTVGPPGTFRSGRDYLNARDVDGSAFGAGFKSLGQAVTKIAVEAKGEQDDLDIIKADAHWKKASLTSAEAIEADPEYANRDKRWGLESGAILDDAAGMIRDPKVREKFKLQKSVDQNTYAERFKSQAVAADKDKKLADLRTYLDEVQNRAIDPKRDNNARLQDYADLDAYITYAEKKGLVTPEQTRAFRNDYIKGTATRFAKTLADADPETLTKYLESLPAYGSEVGDLSAKYESGGRGVGFISTGKDDPGGMSYGVHQLSGAYSMGEFLKSPEAGPYADAFKGLRPQTAEFNRVYKDLASKDPDGFASAQKAFYTRTHYKPVQAAAEKAGFDLTNRGVQEALFSMGVQHGKAAEVVAEAARRLGKDKGDPKKQIEALYEARYDYVKSLRSLPDNTKASVLDRYTREYKDALKYAGETVKDGEPTRVADARTGVMTDATPGAAPAEALPPGEEKLFQDWKAAGITKFDGTGGTPEEKATQDRYMKWLKGGEDTERQGLAIKLFGALDPEQRAQLLKEAKRTSSVRKESQYHDAKRSLDGAVKMIEDFGKPPEGFDLEGTFKTIVESGEPSVVNKYRGDLVKAQRMYDAKFDADGTPIERMSDERLMAHKQALVPSPDMDPKDYAVASEVYEKTKQQIDKLEKLRQEDPALAVDSLDEVKGIAEAVARNDGSATMADLVDARLAAQERLGIDPDNQKPLTKVEAKALLDLPDDPSRLTEKQYKLRLQSAADRAEQQYGPLHARKVFEAAIAQHVKDKTGSEASAGIITKMVKGEQVKLEDYRRMNAMFEADRVASTFDRSIRPDMGDESRPFISPLHAAGEKRFLTEYAGQAAKRQPTPELEGWIQSNPDQWAMFDAEYGRGAAARAIAKAKKAQPKPAR